MVPSLAWAHEADPQCLVQNPAVARRVTAFIDESGPTDDYVVLGLVLCEAGQEEQLREHLARQTAEIEQLWPKLANMPEWHGSVLGRRPTRSRRSRIRLGEEPNRATHPAIFARGLAAVQRVAGVWALALAYEWTSAVTPASRGADYRLRRATLLALTALAAENFIVVRATVDRGHDAGYSAAFGEHFEAGSSAAVPTFVDSKTDRRVQLADLVATSARQAWRPSGQFFPGSETWLDGLVGPRLIRDGANTYHHRVEP